MTRTLSIAMLVPFLFLGCSSSSDDDDDDDDDSTNDNTPKANPRPARRLLLNPRAAPWAQTAHTPALAGVQVTLARTRSVRRLPMVTVGSVRPVRDE